MDEVFYGELAQFPYRFCPANWAYCHGQLLSIAENDVLFTLLGTTYGGDGGDGGDDDGDGDGDDDDSRIASLDKQQR